MSTFGRRTFLASSTGIAAGAAVAGALPALAAPAGGEDAERYLESAVAASASAVRVGRCERPLSRRTVSSTPPASTPTTARSPGPCKRRTAPWHRRPFASWSAGPTPGSEGSPGTAAPCCPLARPSSPTGGRHWPPTRRTSGRCRRVVQASAGARSRPRPGSRPRCERATGRPNGCSPPATSQQPDRVTYLRTEVTPAAGTLHRATAYVSAAHTYRLYVDGVPVDAWPSFSYPDEQYARAVDLTGALAGGRASAIGVLHRWYGPGQGRPASAPGLLFQLSLQYNDGRHDVVVSDASWRERPAEWLPSPQRNPDGGDFVEWVDGRAASSGLVRARVRRPRLVGGHRHRPGRDRALHHHLPAADDDP